MRKFAVELTLTYVVEAETSNDAMALIDGMRYENFLPIGYYAEEEEIAEANQRYSNYLGSDKISQSKLISRKSDCMYYRDEEE